MKLIFASQASKHNDLGSLPFPLEDTRQTGERDKSKSPVPLQSRAELVLSGETYTRQTKQLKKEAVARNGSWDDQTHVDKTGETYSIDFDRLHQTHFCKTRMYCNRCSYSMICETRGA